MSPLILGLLSSLVVSSLSTKLLIGWARRRHQFSLQPRQRDIHQKPTPRVGGVAIVATVLLIVAGFVLFRPGELSFTKQTFLGIDRNLLGFILATILLSTLNILDDWRGLPWWIRLLSQIAAASLVVIFGIEVHWFSSPLGGKMMLGSWDWLFAVGWIVILSNALNWLDGVDGLAGGVSSIGLTIIIFLSLSPQVGQSANALLAAIVLGAVLGFLPFNLGGKVFLGDTGSVFLGFAIAVVAIISGGKVATAFLVLAVPVLDALQVVALRLYQHKSPFLADKTHLHHRLLSLGWNKWQIVSFFYVCSLLFGLIALKTQTIGKLWAAVAALGVMAVIALIVWFSRRRALANPAKQG